MANTGEVADYRKQNSENNSQISGNSNSSNRGTNNQPSRKFNKRIDSTASIILQEPTRKPSSNIKLSPDSNKNKKNSIASVNFKNMLPSQKLSSQRIKLQSKVDVSQFEPEISNPPNLRKGQSIFMQNYTIQGIQKN